MKNWHLDLSFEYFPYYSYSGGKFSLAQPLPCSFATMTTAFCYVLDNMVFNSLTGEGWLYVPQQWAN